jgi:hypothetical protein
LTKFTSFFAKEKVSKLSVLFLLVGVSFLFPSSAQANMGLQAYFYDNQTGQDNLYNNAPPIPPDRPLVFSIPVATVDQDFDLYPMPGLYEDFVVKYEGYLTATESATVNLQCLADDGCIVIIDGVTIIDEWYDKGTSGDVYQYTLVPNQSLPFTVWYYENGGGALIQLRWQFPDGEWAVVPEAVFSTVPKVIPIPVVSPSPETQTVVGETVTASSDTQTAPVVDTLTPVLSETSTSVVESVTVVTQTQDTLTVVTETVTVVDTSTATSEPPVVPEPAPIVAPEPPVVRPEPIAIPDPPPVAPDPAPEPEPEPEPVPEEPPVPVEEPPAPEEEPPAPAEEPPTEAEEPPVEAEEPPIEAEEPPIEAELPPELAPEPPAEEPEPPMVAEEDATEEEKAVVAEAIIEAADGQPVTAAAIASAGLTYADLPAETPVEVRQDENGNEVVITAEVAAALVILENPAELIGAIFTDPGQALLAIGSIGADMSEEERTESEQTIVAAVIAGQAAVSAAGMAAGAASSGSTGGGSSSGGGGGASAESKGVRRRTR